MANTYTLIASSTVGAGGASSIDFTSIPSTYTDIALYVSTRSNSNSTGMDITFNGSTTSFSNKRLYGSGTTASSDSASTTSVSNTMVGDSTYTASTFGNGWIYIPNYTSSNNKSVSVDGVTENNATLALSMLTAGLWSNTAAINRVTLTPTAGSFVQYSTAYLYGVKNA